MIRKTIKNYFNKKSLSWFLREFLPLSFVFAVALYLRTYGLNWDQGYHLHPDERFLTMVVNDIKLPTSLAEYLDTKTSPLNPYNYSNYNFFVYGTLPIFLVKHLAVLFGMNDYDHIQFVGRFASAFFDSLNIIFLYFIARKIFEKKPILTLLPSILYTFCVLPLQLSHFFAVDTFLATFILATFTFLSYDLFLLAAITFGLALGCKITAVIFSPIVLLFLIRHYLKHHNLLRSFLLITLCLPVAFLVFRFVQPYSFIGLFKLNPQFVDSIKTLQLYSSPNGLYPPSVQWLSKTPLLYSLQNILFYGFGIPLSLLLLTGLPKIKLVLKSSLVLYSLAWVLILYLYQGSQFAHNMRYFLPLYPFLILLSVQVVSVYKKISPLLIVPHLLLGVLFLSIYSRPHSRVQASDWIYQNLPADSKITNEYWDDPLPLYMPGKDPNVYQGAMLPLYDPDSPEKWLKLQPSIDQADYIIMSSNRLWGSIPLVPESYPITSRFYQDLFSETLNFKKIAKINSYPGVSIPKLNRCYYFGQTNFPGGNNNWFAVDDKCLYPGIYLRDDASEESFTVYDHPKVLIYQRQ